MKAGFGVVGGGGREGGGREERGSKWREALKVRAALMNGDNKESKDRQRTGRQAGTYGAVCECLSPV